MLLLGKRFSVMVLFVMAFSLLLSACGSPTPTSTPKPPTTAPTAEVAAAATTAATTGPTVAATEAATAEATAVVTEAATEAATEAVAAATEAATVEPTAEVTAEAPAAATVEVTEAATVEPTAEVTAAATEAATAEATAVVTEAATVEPTAEVTAVATEAATLEPTAEVTAAVTAEATAAVEATAEATAVVTAEATVEATVAATAEPTSEATAAATAEATAAATLAACKTTGELTVGSDVAYAPFESVDPSTGEFVGFDIDLIKAIAESAGFTVNIVNAPFDPIFINLAAGQFDLVISAATITEERSQVVTFSNPYFTAGQVITVREADAETIKGRDDLVGKKIGVQLGTTGAAAAKDIPDAQVSEYPTFPEAAQALANGDVDAVVNDDTVSIAYVLNTPDAHLVVVTEPFTTEQYGIAVRKDCTDLLEKVNTGLAEVIASGQYAEIYRKYFGVDPSADYLPGSEGATPEATATAEVTAAATAEVTAEATVAATATP